MHAWALTWRQLWQNHLASVLELGSPGRPGPQVALLTPLRTANAHGLHSIARILRAAGLRLQHVLSSPRDSMNWGGECRAGRGEVQAHAGRGRLRQQLQLWRGQPRALPLPLRAHQVRTRRPCITASESMLVGATRSALGVQALQRLSALCGMHTRCCMLPLLTGVKTVPCPVCGNGICHPHFPASNVLLHTPGTCSGRSNGFNMACYAHANPLKLAAKSECCQFVPHDKNKP